MKRTSALEGNFLADFDGLRHLYTVDPVEAERIRQTIEAELIALTRPPSLSERAETGE